MLDLVMTSQFRKDLKRINKRGKDLSLLKDVLQTLREEQALEEKCRKDAKADSQHKTALISSGSAGLLLVIRCFIFRGSTYENNVAPRDDINLTKHGLKIPEDVDNYDACL